MLTSQQITEARAKLGIPQDSTADTSNLTGENLYNSIVSSNLSNASQPEQSSGLSLNPDKNKPFINVAAQGAKQLAPLVSSEVALGQDLAVKGNKKVLADTLAQHNDLEQRLTDRISNLKQQGQDTTKLDKALSALQAAKPTEEAFAAVKPSTEKLIGDIAGTAIDIGTAGFLPGAGSAAEKAIGTGLKEAITTGAKVGGAVGATQGLASGLQQEKGAAGVVGNTLAGGAIGAVTGGATAGLAEKAPQLLSAADTVANKAKIFAGDVSGAIANRADNKQTSFALDLVSPKATEKVKQQALREGRVTEQGLLSASKILPSARDQQLEEAVRGIVSSNKTPVQNLDKISKTVGEINTGLKAYVAENKVPFNTNQLKSQLNKGKSELNLIFASDKQAEKTYNAVVDEFMKHVKNKDTAGLLDARQAVDKIPAIKKLLDSQGLGENTKKEVVLTVRDMANRYVANLLPEGNPYRATLLKESRMIEAIGNIAEKHSSEIGKNKIQTLTEKYPILKWIVGGAVGSAGVGVGGAIIGSLD